MNGYTRYKHKLVNDKFKKANSSQNEETVDMLYQYNKGHGESFFNDDTEDDGPLHAQTTQH